MRRSPRFFFFLALGIIALVIGLVLGIMPHHVTYQSVGQGTIAHYLSSDGQGYLQMENDDRLYTVNETEFHPQINGLQTISNGDVISFIYEPTVSSDIDETSTLGTHLQGTAYKIAELTLFSTDGSQEYKTQEYIDHPQPYDHSDWSNSTVAFIIGAVLIAAAFLPSRRRPQGYRVAPSPAMGQQGQYPPNAYQQPYQGMGQYPPQYQNAPQYPPQPGSQPQQPGYYQPTQYGAPPQQGGPYQSNQPPSYPPQPGYEPTQRANPYDQQ